MKKDLVKKIGVVSCSLLLFSCGAFLNQPIQKQGARVGEITPMTSELKQLPPPQEPVVVGVYNFRDQTGQYKNIEVGSSFSTAVSQGGTTMLVKALEDSKWFTVVERENLSNLLNERNIIHTTREQYQRGGNKESIALPPLLFAGILLEGGVVSYDTNIITGGSGAMYFGVGGASQYREDRLTVYLRAVSTSNGKVLKTIYVSKTILSQAVSANLFRYVSFKRLLEVETGFTMNEPVQLAMKEAIEKAVEGLIYEGIEDKLWGTAAGAAMDNELVRLYNENKALDENTLLYDREQLKEKAKNAVYGLAGASLFDGDLQKKKPSYMFKVGYQHHFTPHLYTDLNVSFLELKGGKGFKQPYLGIDANIGVNLLPKDRISPFVYGGIGTNINLKNNQTDQTSFKWQYGLGLQYVISRPLSVFATAEHNISTSDKLDGIARGKRKDHYFLFGLGIKYNF